MSRGPKKKSYLCFCPFGKGVCLGIWIGIFIFGGGMGLCISGYADEYFPQRVNVTSNGTDTFVLGPHEPNALRIVGPVVMGTGMFIIVVALVVTCDKRDKLIKVLQEKEHEEERKRNKYKQKSLYDVVISKYQQSQAEKMAATNEVKENKAETSQKRSPFKFFRCHQEERAQKSISQALRSTMNVFTIDDTMNKETSLYPVNSTSKGKSSKHSKSKTSSKQGSRASLRSVFSNQKEQDSNPTVEVNSTVENNPTVKVNSDPTIEMNSNPPVEVKKVWMTNTPIPHLEASNRLVPLQGSNSLYLYEKDNLRVSQKSLATIIDSKFMEATPVVAETNTNTKTESKQKENSVPKQNKNLKIKSKEKPDTSPIDKASSSSKENAGSKSKSTSESSLKKKRKSSVNEKSKSSIPEETESNSGEKTESNDMKKESDVTENQQPDSKMKTKNNKDGDNLSEKSVSSSSSNKSCSTNNTLLVSSYPSFPDNENKGTNVQKRACIIRVASASDDMSEPKTSTENKPEDDEFDTDDITMEGTETSKPSIDSDKPSIIFQPFSGLGTVNNISLFDTYDQYCSDISDGEHDSPRKHKTAPAPPKEADIMSRTVIMPPMGRPQTTQTLSREMAKGPLKRQNTSLT